MKHNKNHDNGEGTALRLVPVRFEFTHPTATIVCVAGCFNHWQPEAKTLHSAGGGCWLKKTSLAPKNAASSWTVSGYPIRRRRIMWPIHLAEETRF